MFIGIKEDRDLRRAIPVWKIEQFNKDLDAIVEFVKQVKKSDNIFLLGHSWGGGLTSYYLSNPTDGLAHQAKVKGFVMDAGAYSIVGAMQQSVLNMKAYAAEQTAANKDKQYWKGFDDFITQNPKITADKFIDYTKYVNKAKGVFFANPFRQKHFFRNGFNTLASNYLNSDPYYLGTK